MAAEYGFVYFLSNSYMPGIYKIGYTTQHPQTRVDQLSSATACPVPFEIAACFGCEFPSQMEAQFHQTLNKYRVNGSREFFKIPAKELLYFIDNYYCPSDPLFTANILIGIEMLERNSLRKKWFVDYFFSQDVDPIFRPEEGRGFN